MAVDMFLKMQPIKGESQDEKHQWEIDILTWSWGLSQTGTTHSASGGTGAGANGTPGKVSIQDLTFTHNVDLASMDLEKACLTGQHFNEAILTVRKAGGEQLEYFKIKMSNVIVTHVSIGGGAGAEHLTENVTLNFQKFHNQYTQQSRKGTAVAKPQYGWDIAQNKEW